MNKSKTSSRFVLMVIDHPNNIAINEDTNTIYLTNSGANINIVSVISEKNNTKIKDIFIVKSLDTIAINEDLNTIYVDDSYGYVPVISVENNTHIKNI